MNYIFISKSNYNEQILFMKIKTSLKKYFEWLTNVKMRSSFFAYEIRWLFEDEGDYEHKYDFILRNQSEEIEITEIYEDPTYRHIFEYEGEKFDIKGIVESYDKERSTK